MFCPIKHENYLPNFFSGLERESIISLEKYITILIRFQKFSKMSNQSSLNLVSVAFSQVTISFLEIVFFFPALCHVLVSARLKTAHTLSRARSGGRGLWKGEQWGDMCDPGRELTCVSWGLQKGNRNLPVGHRHLPAFFFVVWLSLLYAHRADYLLFLQTHPPPPPVDEFGFFLVLALVCSDSS